MSDLRVKRIYEPTSDDDGARILVDRLWPRGMSKENAKLSLWMKDIAPSNELRKNFSHMPSRFEEFTRHYHEELAANPDAVAHMTELMAKGRVTLLYAAHDIEHNHALVLADYLRSH
ncbi:MULTISPECIES: DUF488 domain-containing protein [Agrobacterium]|uniref:DUF488 domain-containing protein n=1 Tax=Agrobacterium salinitolerans TaxID=1183413 RepID=A0A4Z1QNQ7_9HYPH|nr:MULTISPECIES: DUF488 domain-containing protein [Agrobacterium]MCZ7865651.1 DUF488 domain-containing protein [Agrobacterium salinitolerans]MDA5639502.1 DUF488 domain-containing protein [Agrobacterium sp. ST15.13.013]MDA6999463.1 DUF488 domain-containing protein [Agrobacterium salinitolerans]QXC49239.1 DUF488 domain-containing protein [Agrobacterium salinitolerans]QXC52691.1 DUF488 domain-containing protein [Agrobacterium salinitolerans]